MHVMKYLWEKPGKRKRKVILWGIAILLLLLNLLVYCDSMLYHTPIAKVISAKNTHTETVSGELEINEYQYVQTLICVVQNGSDKGKTVMIANTYSYTHMDSDTYHRGDFCS